MERVEDNNRSNLKQYIAESVHSESHPAVAASTLDERPPGGHEDSQKEAEYEIPPCTCTVQHTCPGRIIKFVQDDVVIKQVPNNKEMVNKQAREYVGKGSTLRVPWCECFGRLERTKSSTVIVTPIRPCAQKFQHKRTVTEIILDQEAESH